MEIGQNVNTQKQISISFSQNKVYLSPKPYGLTNKSFPRIYLKNNNSQRHKQFGNIFIAGVNDQNSDSRD
jgi:hypothetical protein